MYATKRTKSKWVVRWWKVLCSVVFGADWIMSKGEWNFVKVIHNYEIPLWCNKATIKSTGGKEINWICVFNSITMVDSRWLCVQLIEISKGNCFNNNIESNGIKTTTTKTMMMETQIGSDEKLKCMQLSFITL